MKLTITKRDVTDIATLEKLVVDHIDAIEPGLTVIDSRLLLGHATIDLVAQDARGSLVLVALGLRSEENMLLRIVDAYSWCLEYPEAVQRHYPALTVSEAWPPRVVFVMTRVPESFQRKIKQLSFPAVDAVEFHALDVDGTPAVFFDTVSRIRRPVVADAPELPDIATVTAPRPEPVRLAAELASRITASASRITDGTRVIAGASDASAIETAPVAPVAVEVVPAPATEAAASATPERPSAAEPEPTFFFSGAARPAAAGIQLPKEGVLTRQWMDYLSQIAAK